MNMTNPARTYYKSGTTIPCARCGKMRYWSRSTASNAKMKFCSRECSVAHIKESRRKISNCTVCAKQMTGDDLRQFWGKCGRDESGKIHGMCRACKTKKDEDARNNAIEEKEKKRAHRLKTRGANCGMCGTFTVVNSDSHWCKACAERSPVAHRKLCHKIRHAKCMLNPKSHLKMVFRVAMRQCLKGLKKHRSTFDLLGYSVEDLKRHLEKKFAPGMTWENYGRGWHVDHIIPLSAFNFASTDDADFRRAWALSNLRPLWAEDNMRKGATVENPFQPFLAIGAA